MSLRAIFKFIVILFRYTDNPPELCIRKNEGYEKDLRT